MRDTKRIDCSDCNTPDIETNPSVGGEVIASCPNCFSLVSDFDREYKVVDPDDDSPDGVAARDSNARKGFFW